MPMIATASSGHAPDAPRSLTDKIAKLGWRGGGLIAAILALVALGAVMLYSVGGDPSTYDADAPWWTRGSWDPYASRHITRALVGLVIMMALALAPISFWRMTAYPAYLGALVMLIAVEFVGVTGMGAQRWLDVGPIRFQPSEAMKLALIMALARYYDDLDHQRIANPLVHFPALIMLLAPAALVARQPDLGTALLIAASGLVIVFLAGLPWRQIFAAAVLGLIGLFVVFTQLLQPYQRQRIIAFLDPEADPMGAGYQVLQSKIAIGSGGVWGKGLGEGTQTQLDFLPEKHTDFIFTVIGEELGFVGGLTALTLVAVIVGLGLSIAMASRHQFGRLAAAGVSVTFAFYAVINTAMVMGMLPVVGVPLPMVSHGGTVMIAVMASLGLALNVQIHRDASLGRGRTFL